MRPPWEMVKMKERAWRQQTDELIQALVRLKHEAGRLGLYRTLHKMNAATRMVGWEVAAALRPTDVPVRVLSTGEDI